MATEPKGAPLGDRVLVWLPTRRDREVTLSLLERADICAIACDGAAAAAAEFDRGAGAILMTDAAFVDPGVTTLLEVLSRQPSWSEVPLVILCRPGPQSPQAARAFETLTAVTVLERPSSARTLVSSIRAALRARARQYQLRDQIETLHATEAALRDSELRFRTMADSMPQLAWMAHADGYVHWYNRRWYDYTGTTLGDAEGWKWQSVLDPARLPEALERWQTSIRHGLPFDMEFPLRGADGRFRTFLTRVMPLKNAAGEVVQWFGTNTDIEEAKRTEAQLRATEVALREADRRKDLFLATLAHELRNPLAPLRTAAQILGSPQLSPQQSHWVQSLILRQVGTMARLLDDLLDVARITQGKLLLKREYVELTTLVDAAVETARPLLDEKKHRLIVRLPGEVVRLHADPLRLAQVLSNLLTNAAKYTNPGGEIEVTCELESTDRMLRMSVKDNGIGIPPDEMPRLFVMFSQVHSTVARSEGGLGIGLSLVKGLVELHGGRVEVRSAGAGQGSQFIVRVPHADGATLEANPEAPRPPTSRGRRILVADDNKDAAQSLALLLELAGHEVRVAHDGRAAVSLAQAFRPDTALLDIGMPELSGYEVAEALRREAWGSAVCLIALTGWGQEADQRRAHDAGFDYHVTKPINPSALDALLTAGAPRLIAP